MSQTSDRDLELGNHQNGHLNHPQLAPSQPSQGEFDFGDGSGPLFSMYSKIAQEEDNKRAERSQKDCDMIIIFTTLFSATVAALINVSIQDLKPNPQDTSTFYLKNIYELFADSDSSHPGLSTPSTRATPLPFSPPRYAVVVNSLWFLSLFIGLTTAFMTSCLQQYARRYIRITQQPRCSPEKRARIRALFANCDASGWSFLKQEDNSLLISLHLSFILFLIGAAIYLYNTNFTVFLAVVWCLGLFAFLYCLFTLMPLESDELLFTPFSEVVFDTSVLMSSLVRQLWSRIILRRPPGSSSIPDMNVVDLVDTKWKAAEQATLKKSPKLDVQVLEWTLDRLADDDALEKFFEAIPGFFESNLVHGIKGCLSNQLRIKFSRALNGFLNRTFSFNSVSDSVRSSRLVTCLNAVRAALGPDDVSRILSDILNGRWHEVLQSIEIGHALRRWGDEDFSSSLRRAVIRIISSVREHDDRWVALVKDEFHITDRDFQDYVAHGDSLSLAILNDVNRSFLRTNFTSWSLDALRPFTRIDIRDTLPTLQHDFCSLWNEIAHEAQNREAGSAPVLILREIRHIYDGLHQGTASAPTAYSDVTRDDDGILSESSSYPLCGVIDHRMDFTPHTDNLGQACIMPEAEPPPSGVFGDPIYTSPCPPFSGCEGSAAAYVTQDNADDPAISGSGTANPKLVSIPCDDPSQQHAKEAQTTPSAVIGFPRMPIPMLVLSGENPATLSFPTSTATRTDPPPHFPEPSFITHMPVPLQVLKGPYQYATSSNTTASFHDNIHDQNPPILMRVFGHPPQFAPLDADIAMDIANRQPPI